MMSQQVRSDVFRIIEKQEPEIIRTLSDLVAIPSVCGSEGNAQQYVKRLYTGLGLKVTEFQADKNKVSRHPAFTDSGIPFAGRPNIIGILEGDRSARSLILNGHIDVVSPEPREAWDSDPWQAKIVGRKLFGRGAVDMKGGLVANYFALKSLLEAGVKPKGNLTLMSVVEEEAGGGPGTLACLMEGYTADGMVITEPRPEITIAMTGVFYFRVRVIGKTAHSGLAHLGVNAIGKMNKVYDAMVELDAKRAREKHYAILEQNNPRSCHLAIGTLKAGDWPSTVAGWAEMECRISMIPGEKFADVKREVEGTIAEAASRDEWMREHPPEVTWFGWRAEPWEQDPDHPFIRTFKSCAEDVFRKPLPLGGRTSGLDTRFAQYFNMAALTFGPAGGAYHSVNEYIELDSLMDVTKTVALFITEWCGTR